MTLTITSLLIREQCVAFQFNVMKMQDFKTEIACSTNIGSQFVKQEEMIRNINI